MASAGVLDVSRADGILANTAAPTVCITSDLPVIRPESAKSSKRIIVLPTRLTCCFPKGSVPSFLLETKMAVL